MELTVRFAWWLLPVVYVYAVWCGLMGRRPDRGRIGRLVAEAVRVSGPG